jgi:Holliday junction DNA helicase RuvA
VFYYIQGTIALLEPTFAVVDVGGVGYKLTVSGTTYDAMPPRSYENPPTVKLFTYLAVREDDIELFGFATQAELSSFKMLISVSGVGPKAAISILGVLTVSQLAQAIATEDAKAIARAPGVGAKTAARIVLDLKDKFGAISGQVSGADVLTATAPTQTASAAKADALNALIVLGFSRPQIQQVLATLDPGLGVEELITQALKRLT